MQGTRRKIVQAISYEVLALLVVAPFLFWLFDNSLLLSGAVAVATSLIAVSWNMLFNSIFERWEARQTKPQRTFRRRVLHALGFELGLLLFTTPLLAYGLDISWWQALLGDLAILLFYLVYALFFQWGFDLIFDPPAATLGEPVNCH
jgi:uncharacterized membrane protein